MQEGPGHIPLSAVLPLSGRHLLPDQQPLPSPRDPGLDWRHLSDALLHI